MVEFPKFIYGKYVKLIKVTRINGFNSKETTEKMLINTDLISEVYETKQGCVIYLMPSDYKIEVSEKLNEILVMSRGN